MLATVRGDLSPVLRCPAILLGGVHPVPDVRVTIPEMEGQLPCAGHLDMVDPLGKGLLIKCFKAHRTGGFLQDDPVRDFLPDAAPALLFSRPACPGFHLLWLKSTLCPVEPLAVHGERPMGSINMRFGLAVCAILEINPFDLVSFTADGWEIITRDEDHTLS